MSGRNWKRTQRQKQAVEHAMQQRYAEVETPIVQKKVAPGWKKVVLCVPGTNARVVEQYEGPKDDA